MSPKKLSILHLLLEDFFKEFYWSTLELFRVCRPSKHDLPENINSGYISILRLNPTLIVKDPKGRGLISYIVLFMPGNIVPSIGSLGDKAE